METQQANVQNDEQQLDQERTQYSANMPIINGNTYSENMKAYVQSQQSNSRMKQISNTSIDQTKTQSTPRNIPKTNNVRVTNSKEKPSQHGARNSSQKKDGSKIDYVKANRSILNNTNKISPQNLLQLEEIQKKQAERIQYQQMANRTASPGFDPGNVPIDDQNDQRTVSKWDSQDLQNIQSYDGQIQQNSSNPQHNATMLSQLSQDVTIPDMDQHLTQSRDYVHYGDLNVDENGQFLGASQAVNYGPRIPDLDLNRALTKPKKKSKSQNPAGKKKKVQKPQQPLPKNLNMSKRNVKGASSKSPANNYGGYMVPQDQSSSAGEKEDYADVQQRSATPISNQQLQEGNRVIKIGAVLGNVNIINQNGGQDKQSQSQPESHEEGFKDVANHITPAFNLQEQQSSNQQAYQQIGQPIPSNRVLPANVEDSGTTNEYAEHIYLQEGQARFAVGSKQSLKSKPSKKQMNNAAVKKSQRSSIIDDDKSPYSSSHNMPSIDNIGASMNKSKKNNSLKRDSNKNSSRNSQSNQRDQNQDFVHGSVGDSVIIKEEEQTNEQRDGPAGQEMNDQIIYHQADVEEAEDPTQEMSNSVQAENDDNVNFILQPNKLGSPDLPEGFAMRQSVPETQIKSVFDHEYNNMQKGPYLFDSPNVKSDHYFNDDSFQMQQQKLKRNTLRNSKKHEQITDIRKAYDQPQNNTSLAQHKKKDTMMSMPQTIQKSAALSKIEKYHIKNVKQSLATNAGSQQMIMNVTKYSNNKERTATTSGMGSTALPKIPNTTGLPQYDRSEPRDFSQKDAFNSSSRTKYGAGILQDEKNRTFNQYDFNKRKKKASGVPLDIFKPGFDMNKYKLDQQHINELNSQIQEENNHLVFGDPLHPSVLDSYEASLQSRHAEAYGVIETSRKRPKTKQLGSTNYDHRWKYNAYKLVPVNYQPKDDKDAKKQKKSQRLASQVFFDARLNRTQDQNRQRTKKAEYNKNKDSKTQLAIYKANLDKSDRLNLEADQIGIIQTNTTMAEFNQEMPLSMSPDNSHARTKMSARRKQKINISSQKVPVSKNQMKQINELQKRSLKQSKVKRSSKSPVKDYDSLTKEEKRQIDAQISQIIQEEDNNIDRQFGRMNLQNQTTMDDQQLTVTNTNYNDPIATPGQEDVLAKNQTPMDFNSQSENMDLLNQSIQQSLEDSHLLSQDNTQQMQEANIHFQSKDNSQAQANWKESKVDPTFDPTFDDQNVENLEQLKQMQEQETGDMSPRVENLEQLQQLATKPYSRNGEAVTVPKGQPDYITNKSRSKKKGINSQQQQILDPKTAEQTEKLKKVVSSKQQLNQTSNNYNDSSNPLEQTKYKDKKDKNKIKKINNTYQIANQTNLGRKMLNRQIELLNQKEQRDANKIVSTEIERLNQRIKSQRSPRDDNQSPGHLRQIQTNHHKRGTTYFQGENKPNSPYAANINNHIELNKHLRDRQNLSQFSRISRLTERQNAVGAIAQLHQRRTSERGHTTHSEMSSVQVNKTKAEKKQPLYNDIVNIKLPTYPKADKQYDLYQPVRLSRDSSTQQHNPRTAYRLEKSFEASKEKTGAKASKKLNTSRIHQEKTQDKREKEQREKDAKLKSLTKPLHEGKGGRAGAKERLEAFEKADATTPKQKIPLKSIKEINQRMYYGRKYPYANYQQDMTSGQINELVRRAEQTNQSMNDMITNAPLTSRKEDKLGDLGATQPTSGFQQKSPITSRAPGNNFAPKNVPQAKSAQKHVKFLGSHNGSIGHEYARIGANHSKFIDANSPIDRYYKLYIEQAADEKVFRGPLYGEAYKQSTRLRHARGCVHYKSKGSLSPGSQGKKHSLSPEREKVAKQKLNEQTSIADLMQLTQHNDDARSVLESQFGQCNCHQTNANMLRSRLTKSPSIRSVAGRRRPGHGGDDQSIQAGDAMSMYGDDSQPEYDPYFRSFRSPCRRSCSTNHNPMFHHQRFGLKLSRCIQGGAPNGRPRSAQKTKEQRKKEKKEQLARIDWQKTLLDETVREKPGGGYETANEMLSGFNADLPPELRRQQSNKSPLDFTRDEIRDMDTKDMRGIVRHLKVADADNQKHGILTDKEVHHYYTAMREQAILDAMSDTEKKHLMTKAWKTLGFLMNSLILKNDFQLINASYKQKKEAMEKQFKQDNTSKLQIAKYEQEQLIKVILRCEKMYDAKNEILRILVKVKKRVTLMSQFDEEVEDCSDIRAKGYYYIILKLSCRIFNQVERLRVDNPMLNRPFIYNQANLQHDLVREQLNIRENLRKQFPGLKTALDRVLDKSGQIVKLQHIALMNKELEDQERRSLSQWTYQKEATRKESIEQKHFTKLDRAMRLNNIEGNDLSERGSQPRLHRGSQNNSQPNLTEGPDLEERMNMSPSQLMNYISEGQ